MVKGGLSLENIWIIILRADIEVEQFTSFLLPARARPLRAVFVQIATFHIFLRQMFIQLDEKKIPIFS